MSKYTPQPSTLWTVKDVMARLCIQRTCATEIIKSIPHIRIGRVLRVEKEAVEAYIQQHIELPKGVAPAVPALTRKKTPVLPGYDENGKLLRRKRTA